MANSYFKFKQFTIQQDRCAMKVTTDGCLFGAWAGNEVISLRSEIKWVLDIGTGTGLLALILAQKNEMRIDAIEIDKDAFEQATENIAASPWADRIKIIRGDVKNFLFPHKYDVIISNPPFYENELKADDKKKNIAHHGDELSLVELLAVIKNNLSSGGIFYLLLPYKRNEEIKKLLFENDLTVSSLVFVKQSHNHDYFRIMLAGKIKTAAANETMIEEMAITDEYGQYTARFKTLLGDYYLNL